MTVETKATLKQVMEFFSTPERPVTNAEMMAFAKADKEGLDKLREELGRYLA